MLAHINVDHARKAAKTASCSAKQRASAVPNFYYQQH